MIFHVRYQTADGRNGLAKFASREQADLFCRTIERRTLGKVLSSDDKPQAMRIGTHNKP